MVRKFIKPSKTSRGQSGQGLYLGIAILCLIAFATAGTVIVMVNTAAGAYYLQKLNFVCDQCAQYAANQSAYGDPSAATVDLVKGMMKTMSLGSGNPKIDVSGGGGQMQVSISDNFSLFGQVMGPSIHLSTSATATNQFPTQFGNGELLVRLNRTVSPKLDKGVRIFGNRTYLPLQAPSKQSGDPRYLSSHNGGVTGNPLYGESPASLAGYGL